MKVIINADDYGISRHVNEEIHRYVEKGIISSTTIMANMPNVEDVVELYHSFKDTISFGIHLNLTEGCPLRYSQLLLDEGFYIEGDGKILFYGKTFDYKKITDAMKKEIEKELNCQLEKLENFGVVLSHFDSHQHVHFHKEIISTFIKVAKRHNIHKMRKRPFSTRTFQNVIKSWVWKGITKFHNPSLCYVNQFMSVKTFIEAFNTHRFFADGIYELMCHPGHPGESYMIENALLEEGIPLQKSRGKIELINYNNI